MTKKKRNTLFIVFTVLFFTAIPVIVLFTQGYRINLQDRTLVKTGGLDFGIQNTDALVFVGDKHKKQTNFIFRNAIFRNILPGSYDVRIEKPGYLPWNKTVNVEEERVTKFPVIYLFPEDLQERVYAKNISSVAISPNKKFTLAAADTTATNKNESVLLIDLENGVTENVVALKQGETVSRMGWSDNSDIFYIHTKTARGPGTIYTADAERAQNLINWDSFLNLNYPAAYNANSLLVPSSSENSLFVLEKQSENFLALSEIRLQERIIRPNIASGIAAFKIKSGNLFYIDAKGNLMRQSVDSVTPEVLSPTAVVDVSPVNSQIIVREDENAILVINRGNLFLWQSGEPFRQIGANVSGAGFAPDKEKLIFWNTDTITAYWLEEVFGPPKRFPADTEKITGINNIQNVHWVYDTSAYVLANTSNKIVIAELDSRDKRNIVRYNIKAPTSAFEVNRNTKTIYTLLQGQLKGLRYE